MDQKKTIIIGGGVIGLFSAYYLLGSNRDITVIDSGKYESGCSYGNAGMIVPSHFIPLASPGMIQKGIRWMFDSQSPFYIKPRLSLDLIKWGLGFYRSANKKSVQNAVPYLTQLGLLSKKLYKEIASLGTIPAEFEDKGLMMYCKQKNTLDEEIEVAHWANEMGIGAVTLSREEVHELEPLLRPEVNGAVLYKSDAHLNPSLLMQNLRKTLEENGVKFISEQEIIDFEVNNNSIKKVLTLNSTFDVEDVVLATGSWSHSLGKKLGLNLPIQAGKGYSISVENNAQNKLNIPSILVEARVAMTPMGQHLLRVGGTMEIGGLDSTINMNRVQGIVKSIPNYFPNLNINMPSQSQVWYGFRPCSPDGLPYIGRMPSHKNLFINTGHAMMGISLAPASGLLLSQIMDEKTLAIDIKGFNPERFV